MSNQYFFLFSNSIIEPVKINSQIGISPNQLHMRRTFNLFNLPFLLITASFFKIRKRKFKKRFMCRIASTFKYSYTVRFVSLTNYPANLAADTARSGGHVAG